MNGLHSYFITFHFSNFSQRTLRYCHLTNILMKRNAEQQRLPFKYMRNYSFLSYFIMNEKWRTQNHRKIYYVQCINLFKTKKRPVLSADPWSKTNTLGWFLYWPSHSLLFLVFMHSDFIFSHSTSLFIEHESFINLSTEFPKQERDPWKCWYTTEGWWR